MRRPTLALALLAVTLSAGCGSSGSSSNSSGGAGALSAEAKSAATGDIPDNQNFLTFKGAGFSMKYPEGWSQSGAGGNVTFRDKNNIVHVVVSKGGRVSATSVGAGLAKERAHTPSLRSGKPQPSVLSAGHAFKVTYTTMSAPNPVTGKRVKLTVDRYVVGKGAREATIDLGTPVGVDNVDAYRMMAQSFRLG